MSIELGTGLLQAGHKPYFIGSIWNNGDFPSRLEHNQLPFELMPLGFISARLDASNLKMTGDQLLRWPRLMWAYRRMLNRERPLTIIHTNWHHVLLLWLQLRVHRDLLWLHEIVPTQPRYQRLFRRLSTRIGMFIGVSKAVSESIKNLGVPENKIATIYSGIVDPSAGIIQSNGAARHLRLGIVGQIGQWKGHEDALKALSIVVEKVPDAELHVFGKGSPDFEKHLRQLATSLRIRERTIWHGYVEDRSQIFANLDVCLVPSRFAEPFGLAALEPAFFGKPVIATRRGGLPEIVRDGETGLIVDANEPKQIASAIQRLWEQPELRQKMGLAARQNATERFNRDRFIADFARVLDIPKSSGYGQPS